MKKASEQTTNIILSHENASPRVSWGSPAEDGRGQPSASSRILCQRMLAEATLPTFKTRSRSPLSQGRSGSTLNVDCDLSRTPAFIWHLPSDPTTDRPTDRPAVRPTDQRTDRPTDPATRRPSDRPSDRPTERTNERMNE